VTDVPTSQSLTAGRKGDMTWNDRDGSGSVLRTTPGRIRLRSADYAGTRAGEGWVMAF